MDENPDAVTEDVKNESQSDKEINFARFRKKVEKETSELRSENEQLKEQLNRSQAFMDKFENTFSARNKEEEFDWLPPEDEQKLRNKIRNELKDELKNEIFSDLKNQEANRFHDRLRDKYEDYDSVVTPEAISELEKEDPMFSKLGALAANTAEGKYVVGESLYKKIKASQQQKQVKPKSPLQEKVERNQSRGILSALGSVSFGMPNAYDFDVNDPAAVSRARDALQKAKRSGGYH